MRVRCLLTEIRGHRSIREIADQSGVNRGELSRIERGIMLPQDKHVAALETAYGAPVWDWYPPQVLLAIESEDGHAAALRERMWSLPRRGGMASLGGSL